MTTFHNKPPYLTHFQISQDNYMVRPVRVIISKRAYPGNPRVPNINSIKSLALGYPRVGTGIIFKPTRENTNLINPLLRTQITLGTPLFKVPPRSFILSPQKRIERDLFIENNLKNVDNKELLNIFDKQQSSYATARQLLEQLLYEEIIPSDKDLIKIVEIFKDKSDFSKDDEILLDKISGYLKTRILTKNYPEILSRDKQEYNNFCQRNPDLHDFFKLEAKSFCVTPDSFTQEINRLKKGRNILLSYAQSLTENDLIEICRRSGILVNPDALYPSDLTGNLMEKKASAGIKLIAKAYKKLNELSNTTFTEDNTYPNMHRIVNNMSPSTLSVVTVNRDNMPLDTMLLTGDDLHMVIVIEDPDNPDYNLILVTLTSAKKHTEELDSIQYLGHLKDINKSQRIRYKEPLIKI